LCVFCRCISEICKKSEAIVKDVIKVCGIPFFLDILNTHHEETVNASSFVIQARIFPVIFWNVFLRPILLRFYIL
jgi:hypothetical protein